MAEQHEHTQEFLDAKKKLDEAIAEFHKINAETHDDNEPPIVLGWVLIVASTNYVQYGKGTNYAWVAAEGQPWYHSVGLVEYAKKAMSMD